MAVTAQEVEQAYQALESGDPEQINRWWAEDMRWLVPGNHQLAGWWEGRAGFLDFMTQVGKLSGGSFSMVRQAILVGGDQSADISHNEGGLTGAADGSRDVYEYLNIDVVHVLTWRDGQVVEGKGAIFGDGTTRFNQFWSQVRVDGTRS
ncbi:hypothetical protein GCM10027059_13920 [Myceligenerans halotolerans]